MTGASSWATAPPNLPYSTGCCIVATCSSADYEAGGRRPTAAVKANDKNKREKDAEQRTPGGGAIPDPVTSYNGASP